MRRYHFLAPFASPQEGPDFMPVPPFDKVEVVQGDQTIYPPAPESTCIVSVECQAHTAVADQDSDDPLWPTQRAMLLAPLEAAMTEAVTQMSERYPYLGVEDA